MKIDPAPGTTNVKVPLLISALTDSHVTPERRAEPAAWNTQRTAGIVMGGVGVVGAVLSTVFGVQAFGNSDDSAAHCTTGTPDLCNETGLQLRSDATKVANVSTVAFALGGAAVAGGVVLFVAAPSKDTGTAGGMQFGAGTSAGASTTGILFHGGW